MAENAFEDFKVEAPTLTFGAEEIAEEQPAAAPISTEDRTKGMAEDAKLTPEEMAQVDAFVDLNIGANIRSGDLVPDSSEVTFNATPKAGYMVKGWVVDAVFYDHSVTTPPAPYIVISTDRTSCTVISGESSNVRPVYVQTAFTVNYASNDVAKGTLTAKANGSTLISGFDVGYGNTLEFKATPADGCRVDHWVIERDGTPEIIYSHDTELSIDKASYNYGITAFFETVTDAKHKVNFSAGEHGSLIIRADDQIIENGADVPDRAHIAISAIADSGYSVDAVYVDGVEYDLNYIPFLTADTTITAVFKSGTEEQYTVKFAVDGTSTGSGTVTATCNGNPFTSGMALDERSKVVITATPADGMVVIGWRYKGTVDIMGVETPYDIISYVSKNEHTITSLSSDQDISVIFGTPGTDEVTVSTGAPPVDCSIYMMIDEVLYDSKVVNVGTDVFFTAKVSAGNHILRWVVTDSEGTHYINTRSTNISLYNIGLDTTVTYEIEADTNAPIYFSNDDSLGKLEVSCDKLNIAYSERSNAIAMFNKFNELAQDLMAMETDGKKNVAIAIGPVNGDILFDGDHEWVFDTIWNILPQQYKDMIPAQTYDALIFVWKNVLTYELKQAFNYYLAYKAGFISDVFTEHEGGPEYQYVKFMVVTKEEPMSALSVDTIKQIYDKKDEFVSANSAENGGFVYCAYLSGAAVSNYELSELVNRDFHFIIVVVVLMLILLLFLVMRSYLTPIRAVATIVMSVVWTLGLTYLLFEHLLGMPVVWIVPIVLFVVCLGLGMDYDILLTTRIKECVSKGMSNDDAITAAVQKSGAVITLCGLIMAGAFSTMMMSSSPMLKEFGFALGFAIAVDALVIRTYIVPAIMHLMGDWNWKGPNYGAMKNRLLKKKTEE